MVAAALYWSDKMLSLSWVTSSRRCFRITWSRLRTLVGQLWVERSCVKLHRGGETKRNRRLTRPAVQRKKEINCIY